MLIKLHIGEKMKFLLIGLLLPTFLHASISQCIKSKMYQLGAASHKGNSHKLSELKNVATASCLNIRSVSSERIRTQTVQPTVQEEIYRPSQPVQQSDGTFMDYSNDTPQLNGEWNDRITKNKTNGHSRGISSIDDSSNNFINCVKQTSMSLGARVGMSTFRLNEIKDQANQTCLQQHSN